MQQLYAPINHKKIPLIYLGGFLIMVRGYASHIILISEIDTAIIQL